MEAGCRGDAFWRGVSVGRGSDFGLSLPRRIPPPRMLEVETISSFLLINDGLPVYSPTRQSGVGLR